MDLTIAADSLIMIESVIWLQNLSVQGFNFEIEKGWV